MKLERIVLASQFDPSKLVTSHAIFSKKSIVLETERIRCWAEKILRIIIIFKIYIWRYGF